MSSLRIRGFAIAAIVVVIASCSAAEVAAPIVDPFSGTYTLVSVGNVGTPAKFAFANGGLTTIRTASLAFPDGGHVVFSQTSDTRDSTTAPTQSFVEVDTFALGRLPTQGFVIHQVIANDTVAVITVPSNGRLAWDFRRAGGLGTYVFSR